MASGGKRFGSGRKRGGKNQTTIAREIAAAAQLAHIQSHVGELAIDRLERYSQICEDEFTKLKPKGRKVPTKAFGEWMDRAIYCAKELAQYQSAKIRATVSMQAPASGQQEPPKTAKIIDIQKDPVAIEASYRRMLTAVDRTSRRRHSISGTPITGRSSTVGSRC